MLFLCLPQAPNSLSCRYATYDVRICLYRKKISDLYNSKPKNARSKRVLDARQPKEVEDPRTAIFVKGTHSGEVLNSVMKELVRVLEI